MELSPRNAAHVTLRTITMLQEAKLHRLGFCCVDFTTNCAHLLVSCMWLCAFKEETAANRKLVSTSKLQLSEAFPSTSISLKYEKQTNPQAMMPGKCSSEFLQIFLSGIHLTIFMKPSWMIEDVLKVHSGAFGVATAYTMKEIPQKKIWGLQMFWTGIDKKTLWIDCFHLSLSWPPFVPPYIGQEGLACEKKYSEIPGNG